MEIAEWKLLVIGVGIVKQKVFGVESGFRVDNVDSVGFFCMYILGNELEPVFLSFSLL